MTPIFALIALFILTVFSSPVPPLITLSLSNNITNLSNQATLSLDNGRYDIQNFFKNSGIDFVTGAQLDQPVPNVFCTFHYLNFEVPISNKVDFMDSIIPKNLVPIPIESLRFECSILESKDSQEKRQQRIDPPCKVNNIYYSGKQRLDC